jgi:hypothetical protein
MRLRSRAGQPTASHRGQLAAARDKRFYDRLDQGIRDTR